MNSLNPKSSIVKIILGLGLFIASSLIISSFSSYAAESKGEGQLRELLDSSNLSQKSIYIQTITPFAQRMGMSVYAKGDSSLHIVPPQREALEETVPGFLKNLKFFGNYNQTTLNKLTYVGESEHTNRRKNIIDATANLLLTTLKRFYRETPTSYKEIMRSKEMAAFKSNKKIDQNFIEAMSTVGLEKKASRELKKKAPSSVYRSGASLKKTLLYLPALLPVAQGISVFGEAYAPGSRNPDSTVNITGAGNYTTSFTPFTTPKIPFNSTRGNINISLSVFDNVGNFTTQFSLGSIQAGTLSYKSDDYTTLLPQVINARIEATTKPTSFNPILITLVTNPEFCDPSTLLYTIEDDGGFGISGGIIFDPKCPPSNPSSSSSPTPVPSSTGPNQPAKSQDSGLGKAETAGLSLGITIPVTVLTTFFCKRRNDKRKARKHEEEVAAIRAGQIVASSIIDCLKDQIPSDVAPFREPWNDSTAMSKINAFATNIMEHQDVQDAYPALKRMEKKTFPGDIWGQVVTLMLAENKPFTRTEQSWWDLAGLFKETYQTLNYKTLDNSSFIDKIVGELLPFLRTKAKPASSPKGDDVTALDIRDDGDQASRKTSKVKKDKKRKEDDHSRIAREGEDEDGEKVELTEYQEERS